MNEYLRSWLEPSAFSPHGFCLLWEPGLLWLHAAADALTALAYLSIPVALLVFIRRRKDVSFGWMGGLFAAFILLCGATHIMGLVTLWSAVYWLEGGVKLATALVSVATAILLWPLIPKALAIPSQSALRDEVAQKEAALAQLRELTATLERRVAERTAELAAANARFETALEASGVTVFTQDAALAYTWVSRADLGHAPEEFLGRTDDDLLPAAEAATVTAIKRRVLQTGRAERVEMAARGRWYETVYQPLAGGAGVIGGAVDVTERKRQEARIGFLLNELKHRAANLLAVVQAMLRQTAASAATVAEVEERLGGRLAALAASQRLLAKGDAEAASLRDAIGSHIGHQMQGQVELSGPEIRLPAEAALHIGMALHELSTNAAKYGALSVPEGRVRISWDLERGEHCRILWEERGGPPVAEPTRRGFGREVVEWAVAQSVRGEVRLNFKREGVRWELVFPLDSAAAAQPVPA